jgi:hypothetical protein
MIIQKMPPNIYAYLTLNQRRGMINKTKLNRHLAIAITLLLCNIVNATEPLCTFELKTKNVKTGFITIAGFNHANTIYVAYSKNNWNSRDGWADVTPSYTPGQDTINLKLPESLRTFDGEVCDHFSGTISCFSWDQSKQLISKCDFKLSQFTPDRADSYCDNFNASYDGTNIVLRGLNNNSVRNWIAQTTDGWKTFKDITPNLYQCKTQDTYYVPATKPLGIICMYAHSKMNDECRKTFDLSEFGELKGIDRIIFIRKEGTVLKEIKTIKGNFDLSTSVSIIDKFGKEINLPQQSSTDEGIKIVLDSSIITSGLYTIKIASSKVTSISKIPIK